MRLAAQNEGRSIELRARVRASSASSSRSRRDHLLPRRTVQNGHDRRKQHRPTTMAIPETSTSIDATFGSGGRRRIKPPQRLLGARAVSGQEQRSSSARRARSINARVSPYDPGEPPRAEPPQRMASSKARRRMRLASFPQTGSLRQEGPNQLSTGLREVSRKVVNHNGPSESTAARRRQP